jgi:uncharacterized protein
MAGTFEVPLGRCVSVAPGLPTTDLARTVEHYARLGFAFWPEDAATNPGVGFAIAQRDGIALHFAVKPDHDPARTAGWIHITVEDADAISAEFEAAGADQAKPPRDPDYRMREFAHIDPDGNLLLFGSPIAVSEEASRDDGPTVQAAKHRDPEHDPVAFEFARAIKQGDVERVTRLLSEDPALATAVINSRPPLHLFADAPGHRPNAAAMVNALLAAGADLNTHMAGSWHHETALHWAASNDDVELIDALLDAGADIEHPGSSIGGGSPIQSAIGYAQYAAVRRLWERGAEATLSHVAALGLTDQVVSLVAADEARRAGTAGQSDGAEKSDQSGDIEALCVAFWNACRAGQVAAAQYLLSHGADLNWPASWDGATPLDAAVKGHQAETVAWLREIGARPGETQ